jgi:hypothetical protein
MNTELSINNAENTGHHSEHFGRQEDRDLLSVNLFLFPAFLLRYAAN